MSYKYLQRLSTPHFLSAIYLILLTTLYLLNLLFFFFFFFFFIRSRHQNMTSQSCIISTQDQDNGDDDIDCWEDRHLQPHQLNVSRLSVCSGSSIYGGAEDDNYYGDGNCSYQAIEEDLSRLSMESFDGDVDEEFSDQEKRTKGLPSELLFSDSDKEAGCYSLPATPPRRRRTQIDHHSVFHNLVRAKEYASDNEVHKGIIKTSSEYLRKKRRRRRRRIEMERLVSERDKKEIEMDQMGSGLSKCYSFSGESEGTGSNSTCGAGLVVITRPKGGRRALCMDLDEVKACRDLGFELEHERMLEMPSASRVSLSATSNFDTASSGGNSPIANWRISSPGDDPRDVKSRLKVWAQAVALASTSRHGC